MKRTLIFLLSIVVGVMFIISCERTDNGLSSTLKLSKTDSLFVQEQALQTIHHFDVTGDYVKSKEHIEFAKQRLDSIGLGRSVPMSAILNLEAVYWQRKFNDRDTAIAILENALSMAEDELGEGHVDLSDMLVNLGYMYRENSRFDIAQFYMEKALAGFEQDTAKYAENLSKTLLNIAKLHSYQEHYEKALPLIYRAERIIVGTFGESSTKAALVHGHLASIHFEMEDIERALEYRRKTVSIYEARDPHNPSDLAGAYNAMGLLLSELDDYDGALNEYVKAEEQYLAAYGVESPRMATVWSNMAYEYEQLGEYERSIALHERAQKLELAHYNENDKRIASGRRLLARVYNRVGKYEQALNEFMLAKKVREQLFGTYSDLVAYDHRSISETHRMMGNMKLAYAHLDTFATIRDSILTASRIRSLAEMSERFEAEKKEQENRILKLENDRQRFWLYGLGGGLVLALLLIWQVFKTNASEKKKHLADVARFKSEIQLLNCKNQESEEAQNNGIVKGSRILDFDVIDSHLDRPLSDRHKDIIKLWFDQPDLTDNQVAASLVNLTSEGGRSASKAIYKIFGIESGTRKRLRTCNKILEILRDV